MFPLLFDNSYWLSMHIPYHAAGFGKLSGAGKLKVTWAQLAWAAVTYGKSSSCYHLKHPGHSFAEKKHKMYLLYTCLMKKGSKVFKSGLYEEMDQTEKGAASYFLGMMLTKLFADRLLDTPLLWHLSSSIQAISFSPGKSRPDLIGCSSTLGDWIVAEAKGRSGGFDSSALLKAKAQSQMITSINGNVPKFRFGSESYFSPHLCIKLEDPPAKREAVPLEFNINRAVMEYYSILPLLQSRGSEELICGMKYLTMHDEDLGLAIGLPADFAFPASETEMLALKSVLPLDTQATQLEYLGRDGYFIRLDRRWSDSEMKKEPHIRGG